MKINLNLQVKLLVVILFSGIHAFSQKKTDSLEYVYNYPFKEGYIKYKQKGSVHNPIPFASIYSKTNDVFALTDGKVERIFRIQDEDYVLIRNSDTTFQYGHLDSAVVTKGDIVRRGDLIGKAIRDADHNRYELIFGMAVGTKNMLYYDYAKFIKQYNK